ncbi:MAG TPA: alpha/beta hydrolase [Terriglobales bacterium]|nr:alpha/beta hydrolase [Terriglobales bacterium]
MSLLFLVHGSTQDASGWDLLAPELEQLGHHTARTNLPANEPEASATHYADLIAAAIPRDSDDVVVVAHSASGLFLPLVPEQRQVRQLVFLAAVIPEIGKSMLDQVKAEADMLNPEWIGKDPTRDDALAMKFLFHDCSHEVAHWALGTRRLMYAKQAMTEVCPLKSWPQVPSAYVVCAEDRTVRPEWCRRAARTRLGVEPIELPGGHCPHVSRPKDLARVLDALARCT